MKTKPIQDADAPVLPLPRVAVVMQKADIQAGTLFATMLEHAAQERGILLHIDVASWDNESERAAVATISRPCELPLGEEPIKHANLFVVLDEATGGWVEKCGVHTDQVVLLSEGDLQERVAEEILSHLS